jgi:hypothetical protein
VLIVTVRVVDVVLELLGRADRMSRDPLPAGWAEEPALAGVGSFGALVSCLRRLDRRSDDAVRALARLAGRDEPEACLVVAAGLRPLLIARCDRRPALVAEAVIELAARVADPADDFTRAGVANRLLRRVVWRVRHEHGVRWWQEPVADPALVLAGHVCVAGHEDAVVDRVALIEFRRRVSRLPNGRDAWETLTGAADAVAGLSSTQRSRLERSRRAVRDLAETSLVA